MKQLRSGLDKSLELIGMVLLSVMVLTVLYQVFTRTVLDNPNTVTEEFVRFSLVWLSMLSSAYIVGKKSHLAITLFIDKLTTRHRFVVDLVVEILFLLFASIIMGYGGFRGVAISMAQISPSLSIPMGYVYLAVPVSGIIMFIYGILNLIERIDEEKNRVEGN